MELDLLPDRLALVRLAPDTLVPAWTEAARGFLSVTRTPAELSIVADAAAVPPGAAAIADYRALVVRGSLPLDAVGVMAALATPLSAAGIAIFTIATHDTDWVLVREADLARAVTAFASAGHRIHEA